MPADPRHRSFVHLDVLSCYSLLASPSTPDEYARLAARQLELPATNRIVEPEAELPEAVRALALADYNLAAAVKMARACQSAGIEHIVGLRLRVVPNRRAPGATLRPGELILLARDQAGWRNLIALNNVSHLVGSPSGSPRVDWADLAAHADGLVCLTGPPDRSVLRLAETGPDEELVAARDLLERLARLYPDQLFLELAFLGHASERLANHRLLHLARRLDLPVVATNAVRYATRDQALAYAVLETIRRGRRAAPSDRAAPVGRLATITPELLDSQAYLKSPREMAALFAQVPEALDAAVEIARRCAYRLPLAGTPRSSGTGRDPLGEGGGVAGVGKPQCSRSTALTRVLARHARVGLEARFAAQSRGTPTPIVQNRLLDELHRIAQTPGLAELLLAAREVAQVCSARDVPIAARGSATASLVAWSLGVVSECPLDHDLGCDSFLDPDRPDLPDLDLEIAAQYWPSIFAQALGRPAPRSESSGRVPRSELPRRAAVRLAVEVRRGGREAVRQVGGALGLHAGTVGALARLIPGLTTPGAIEQALLHAPEQGAPGPSLTAEPYRTVLAVATMLENLPYRFGVHPTGLAISAGGEGVPAEDLVQRLPVRWGGADRPSSRASAGIVGLSADAAEEGAPDRFEIDGDELADPPSAEMIEPGMVDQPTVVCQWDKDDLAALGLTKLDLSPSTALATLVGPDPGDPARAAAAAWPGIVAGDTRGIAQLEPLGIRLLLKRAGEAGVLSRASISRRRQLDELAQLLALWRPGAWSRAREDAYFADRAGAPGSYPHPGMAAVLEPTGGQLVYAEQVAELAGLVGLDATWVARFRRSLVRGEIREQADLEKELRRKAADRGWSAAQIEALLTLLAEHTGYLFKRGHAIALADRALRQAARKADPTTAAAFFAELLNAGGSTRYGVGLVADEARRAGVAFLSPCVNRSGERFTVERQPGAQPPWSVRIPLAAIRDLRTGAGGHILAIREAYGPYFSLLDFCRRVDRRLVSRADRHLLIKLGAFGFTGLNRMQLLLADQYYASAAELLRATDRDPTNLRSLEPERGGEPPGYLEVEEWPAGTIASFELAHLGFYATAPLAVDDELEHLVGTGGGLRIAELADLGERAPATVAALVTAFRVRRTKKGDLMAWLTLADGSGAADAIAFPSTYGKIARHGPLAEGLPVLAHGRVSREDGARPTLILDDLQPRGGAAARLSALAASVRSDSGPFS